MLGVQIFMSAPLYNSHDALGRPETEVGLQRHFWDREQVTSVVKGLCRHSYQGSSDGRGFWGAEHNPPQGLCEEEAGGSRQGLCDRALGLPQT